MSTENRNLKCAYHGTFKVPFTDKTQIKYELFVHNTNKLCNHIK